MHAIILALAIVVGVVGACDRAETHDPSQAPPDPNAPFIWPPPVPPAQDDRDARCRAMGESECVRDPDCRVSERSSSCTPDFCTEDLVFHFCMAGPENAGQATAARERLCTETGGVWRASEPVENGTCNCATVDDNTPLSDGPVMETWLGCASFRELCTARGDEWRRIENIREIEVHGEMSGEACVDGHRHSASYNSTTRRCTHTLDGYTCFVDGAEIWDEGLLHGRPE